MSQDQLSLLDAGRVMPPDKIRTTGRTVADPIEQGNLLNSDKIALGNLPQDQVDAFGKTERRRFRCRGCGCKVDQPMSHDHDETCGTSLCREIATNKERRR